MTCFDSAYDCTIVASTFHSKKQFRPSSLVLQYRCYQFDGGYTINSIPHSVANIPEILGNSVLEWQTMMDFTAAISDGDGCGANWNCKMCKVPVRSLSQYQNLAFFYRPDALPII